MTYRVIYEEEDNFGDDPVTVTRYQDFASAAEVTKFVLGLEVTNAMRVAENKCREYEVLSVTEVGFEMLANFKPAAPAVEYGIVERKEHLRKLAEEEKRKAAEDAGAERQRLLERQRTEYARLKAKFEDGEDICVCHGSHFGVVHFRGIHDTHCRDCGCLIVRKCSECEGSGKVLTGMPFRAITQCCPECKGTGKAK